MTYLMSSGTLSLYPVIVLGSCFGYLLIKNTSEH